MLETWDTLIGDARLDGVSSELHRLRMETGGRQDVQAKGRPVPETAAVTDRSNCWFSFT